jgi:uncharacterized protein (TIGR02271 family)
MPTMDDMKAWNGRNLIDRDGDKIGSIGDIYLDAATGRPEWIAVNTGLFGSNVSFVPTAEARTEGDDVRVPYEKSHVKDSPNVDADGALSQDEEARLYRHYGLEYSERSSDTGLAGQDSADPQGVTGEGAEIPGRGTTGRDVSGPETDDAMTRSEEELDVGVRSRETGRVRLRKYIVTEPVETTVQVQREEVRLEREPITDANRDQAMAGGDLTEEEHEVTLRAEEPVVEKNVVPKERVRLDRDTVTEEAQVDEKLRKERIETEGDVARDRG